MPPEVIHILVTALQLYSFILLARILLSWFPNVDRSNQIVQMLYQITEPVLEPVRRAIPPFGMMDLSPLIVFVALHLLRIALSGLVHTP